jgi:hypothetical protein
MTARVLTGSKNEIAQAVASLEGEVREAIVFIAEPSNTSTPNATSAKELFAEMEAYTVQVGSADYTRAGIYSRMPDE